jgi:hypothetical protein
MYRFPIEGATISEQPDSDENVLGMRIVALPLTAAD